MEAGQRGQARVAQARSSFAKSMQKLMQPDTGRLPELPEVPMFYVKHRWMKNRLITHVDLVLCFDAQGFAPVQDVGNNRRLAQQACLVSRGQMEVVESTESVPEQEPEPTPPPIPEPEPAFVDKPKPKLEPKPEPEPEPKPEPEPEPVEKTDPESKSSDDLQVQDSKDEAPKKKLPPLKKKAPGKKPGK